MALGGLAFAKGPENGVSGNWKFKYKNTGGETISGTMSLLRDKDVACGIYKYDTGGADVLGWTTFAVKGNELSGTYYETQEPGPWKFTLDKNSMKGSYEEAGDDGKKVTIPIEVTFSEGLPTGPKSAAGTYDLDFEDHKCTLTLKQSGTQVTGSAKYPSSGDDCGTWRGTASGNLVVGEWKGKDDSGHFFWYYYQNGGNWFLKGGWGTTRESPYSCYSGGKISGGFAK
jgi:hypothetical protein